MKLCNNCCRKNGRTESLLGVGGEGTGHEKTFGSFVAVCFTINYVMGAGFLSLPDAFVASGILFGPIVLVIFAFVCNFTKNLLLDSMARAEGLSSVMERAQALSATVPDPSSSLSISESQLAQLSTPPHRKSLQVASRKFEIPEMFEMFMGKKAKTTYVIILSVYFLGTLWAYASVFASSAAANIPLPWINDTDVCDVQADHSTGCQVLYRIYLLIFMLIVVPLSCLELREQKIVQVTMSAARVMVVVLMVFTVLFAGTCDGEVFDSRRVPDTWPEPTLVNFSGFHKMLPLAVYASIFHHSIPVLAHPVTDKTKLGKIFGYALITVVVGYLGIGLILAGFFGHQVEDQCNLMYKYYYGCSHGNEHAKTWWAHVIAFIVLIFPALDIMSAYPLNAITLGNNLQTVFAPSSMHKHHHQPDASSSQEGQLQGTGYQEVAAGPRGTDGASSSTEEGDSVGGKEGDAGDEGGEGGSGREDTQAHAAGGRRKCCSMERFRKHRTRLMFRILASAPPIAGAFVVSKLGDILEFTGLIGFIIALLVPPVLWKASQAVYITVYATQPDGESLTKHLRVRMEHNAVLFDEVPYKGRSACDRFLRRFLCFCFLSPQRLRREAETSSNVERSGLDDYDEVLASDMKPPQYRSPASPTRGMNWRGFTWYSPSCVKFPSLEVLGVCSVAIIIYVFVSTVIQLAHQRH